MDTGRGAETPGGTAGGGGGGNTSTEESPDYTSEAATFRAFLSSFVVIGEALPFYPPILRRIKSRQQTLLQVHLAHLNEWDDPRGFLLMEAVQQNSKRYQDDVFCRAVDEMLEEMVSIDPLEDPGDGDDEAAAIDRDALLEADRRAVSVRLAEERRARAEAAEGVPEDQIQGGDTAGPAVPGGTTADFPPELMRRYQLRLVPEDMTPMLLAEEDELYRMKATEPLSLRDIRSHAIGSLVTVRAIVTRTSDVRPRCSVATYTCDACGHEVYQVVRGSEFLPATTCPVCVTNDNPNRAKNLLHLQIRGSALVKHQEARVQEMPGQVPTGHVPRTLTVHLVGEMARTCVPGDVVRISGIYLPKRAPVKFGRGGSMHLGLVATAYLEATAVHVEKKGYEDMLVSVSDAAASGVSRVAHGMDPVGRLARSLAPEIYGHEDVKRSMLLQLVGGSSRKLKDGMKIRGDINILLMGDPGVAKSQLLKYVAGAAPRGVYTTGRGSSGVGLTAAVTRDANTGDLSLEGGALVLADMGVCCIDEFDKMEDTDRTAIHEVMEQQTVSIAKAGITATLNARAAVLAAANPLYGRYNRHKSLSENINLPNSLLSRFDLLFLLLDVPDADHDVALARHVTYVHKTGKTVRETEDVGQKRKRPSARLFDEDGSDDTDSEEEEAPLDAQIIREYIRRARMHHPTVPVDVAPYIVEAYVGLRMQNHNVGPVPIPAQQRGRKETYGRPASAPAHDQTVMTARQLLSILRLGQALARLRFSNYVAKEDVDEAIRITHMSRASLHDHVGKDGRRKEDVPSRIFGVLKEHMNSSGRNRLEMAVCEAMVLRKGFTAEQLKKCLAEYEELDILSVNGAGTQVDFLV